MQQSSFVTTKSEYTALGQKALTPIVIIGVGATGSNIAVALTRTGFTDITIYDYDVVEAKNINNQAFYPSMVGMAKTEALEKLLKAINPEINLKIFGKFDENSSFTEESGVFLCVDKGRRPILDTLLQNCNVSHLIETRISTDEYIITSTDIRNREHLEKLLETLPTLEEEEHVSEDSLSPCKEVMGTFVVAAQCANHAVSFLKTRPKGIMYYVCTDANTIDKK